MGTNDAWLARGAEEALEPELPICDPHHHLWDQRQGSGVVSPRYLLDELLADLACGHNVVSTVFIECGTMFDAAAEPAFAPVGETEFANGLAAMSASGSSTTRRRGSIASERDASRAGPDRAGVCPVLRSAHTSSPTVSPEGLRCIFDRQWPRRCSRRSPVPSAPHPSTASTSRPRS